MRLNPAQLAALISAMAESFDQNRLDLIFMSRFGHSTGRYAGQYLDDMTRAMRIVQEFQARNEIEVLVAVLRDARPKVVELAGLAEQVGLIEPVDMGSLQVVARPVHGGTIGHDPAGFRADLAAREDTICRIVVEGERYGTGTLVGPDLVLTNHHVVKSVLQEDGRLAGSVICQFDYRQAKGGYATPATPVAATAAIAFSPHSPQDLAPSPVNTAADKLDYSLLRLASRIGQQPIVDGGDPRGFTPIQPPPATPLAANQPVLLLQHPDALPLRLDLGTVTELYETRLRHNANTLGGSSGSPVFDGDLAFAALHQAGYDWPGCTPPMNQAIPIGLILADLASKGVTLS